VILLISASWVARITDMSHHYWAHGFLSDVRDTRFTDHESRVRNSTLINTHLQLKTMNNLPIIVCGLGIS
jgi:hypothetical protein